MNSVEFLVDNKKESIEIIQKYFKNFVDEDIFDEDSYEKSAGEGELLETYNEELFSDEDEEYILADSNEVMWMFNKIIEEALELDSLRPVKKYFKLNS